MEDTIINTTADVSLLTEDERIRLPLVISRRAKIRQILRMCIKNFDKTASNCILIQGKPGSGKTTLTEDLLNIMQECGEIGEYKRVPGHVTPTTMFGIMSEVAEPCRNNDDELIPNVLILDDADWAQNEGVLEIIKAGFDTKSNLPTNRKVCSIRRAGNRMIETASFKFNGFGIIITNEDFSKKKLNVHQQAVLDRVQQLSIDLEPGDMMIYTSHIIEKMLQDNEDHYSMDEIRSIVKMFNTDIRRWMETNAFARANVNFSTRLIKKFVDAQRMFGNEWQYYSIPYKNLNAAAEIAEQMTQDVVPADSATIDEESTIHGMPKQDKEGRFINPITGKPYSNCYQYQLRRKYSNMMA